MADTTTKQKVEKEPDPTFTVAELLVNAYAITGHERYVVAGAFSGVDTDAEFTAAKAKARVESWLTGQLK